jgi:hypothetical protein
MQPKAKDLCNYRLKKSKEDLKAARILFKENSDFFAWTFFYTLDFCLLMSAPIF